MYETLQLFDELAVFIQVLNVVFLQLTYICGMKKSLLILIVIFIASSCATKKQIVYFQDADEKTLNDVKTLNSHLIIQENDILDIKVHALNPMSTIPFNRNTGQSNMPQRLEVLRLFGYVVDQNGEIDFPQLGKVRLAGKTTQEAQDHLRKLLSKEIIAPNVKLTLINFKFTITGEVRNPGTFEVIEENLTLPQALGMAGDLTITGRRENILLIRHNPDGEREIKRIDLTSTDWMNTDAYFIRQNDLIYVEPNQPKVKSAGFVSNVGTVSTVISIILSTVVLITR